MGITLKKIKKTSEIEKNQEKISKKDNDFEKNQYRPRKSVEKPEKLNETEYAFFNFHTGLSEDELSLIYEKYNALTKSDRMDQETFRQLYCDLRPEPNEQVYKISAHVFRCFDADKNGKISFNEFLMGYVLTTKGDMKKKLEILFNMYDINRDGYLTVDEIKRVLIAMLDLLGNEDRPFDVVAIANKCFSDLDHNYDGQISKDEFVQGLMRNYGMRSIMSPFN